MNLASQIFTEMILQWYDRHGRKQLPWQTPRTPYRVWLSEMMLQQTQVKTVIPYFNRFVERFPDIETLALATEDDVMALWAGLGYYSRARHLHQTAQHIHMHFNNQFPQEIAQLCQLPGIGPSTAAAIASLAFNKPTAILDGNVKRVLCRYFGIQGYLEEKETQNKLWKIAQDCMPQEHCAEYTQAIMDMGALCCTRQKPQCSICPLNQHCIAYNTQQIQSYANKKPKAKIPEKHQHVLLFYTQDKKIYLEKRPASGIWGSLWCLPCLDITVDLDTHVNHITTPISLLTIKHTLTHMRLHLNVSTCFISCIDSEKSDFLSLGRWFFYSEIIELGIPKPMKQIITHFSQ